MHAPRYGPWAGLLLVAGLHGASAQDGDGEIRMPAESAPERCVSLNRVNRTEVIDDRTLIFHMRGGGIYLNYLERECPRLAAEERFAYSPTGNRLCNVDSITVLERWGFGFTRGFTCQLGDFHPISEVELADLKRTDGDTDPERRSGGGFEVVPVDPEELDEENTSADDEGDDDDEETG